MFMSPPLCSSDSAQRRNGGGLPRTTSVREIEVEVALLDLPLAAVEHAVVGVDGPLEITFSSPFSTVISTR